MSLCIYSIPFTNTYKIPVLEGNFISAPNFFILGPALGSGNPILPELNPVKKLDPVTQHGSDQFGLTLNI